MERLEKMTFEIANVIAAKDLRRKALAALPYGEKVRAVVALQRAIVPIVKKRNPRACIWKISEN